MAVTTLATLTDNGGVFTGGNLTAVNAAITAQNANNTSLVASVAAAATTPVGSSQLDPTIVQYATVAATLAQLRALNSVGISLVAAQGAGTLIEMISSVVELVYGSLAFSGGGAVTVNYGLGGSAASLGNVAAAVFTGLAANQVQVLTQNTANLASTVCLNKALVLQAAAADFTGGTGCSGIIKVAYRVHSGLS